MDPHPAGAADQSADQAHQVPIKVQEVPHLAGAAVLEAGLHRVKALPLQVIRDGNIS